jgi:hypothetical protein
VFREISLPIRRSTVYWSFEKPRCPLAFNGEIRRGFFKTHEKLWGNQPNPARLFFSRLASSRVYGLTSDKMATPTKAPVIGFFGFSPKCRASSASIFAAT